MGTRVAGLGESAGNEPERLRLEEVEAYEHEYYQNPCPYRQTKKQRRLPSLFLFNRSWQLSLAAPAHELIIRIPGMAVRAIHARILAQTGMRGKIKWAFPRRGEHGKSNLM
jgi:hypothetical protein